MKYNIHLGINLSKFCSLFSTIYCYIIQTFAYKVIVKKFIYNTSAMRMSVLSISIRIIHILLKIILDILSTADGLSGLMKRVCITLRTMEKREDIINDS